MPRFRGYYLCPNYALFRCLCESSGLISSISRISEYLRLIKPDCNATGAFPAWFYLSFTNPRLGIKWIQIFLPLCRKMLVGCYCLFIFPRRASVGCITFGKGPWDWSEKKREIYRTLDSHRSPCQVIFYKNLRQKTFTKQRFYHKATATTLRNTQQTPIHPHDNKNLGRNSDNQNN